MNNLSGRLQNVRITGVVKFSHVTRRKKFIGRNAKRDVHGFEAHDHVLRLYSDSGVDGIGFGRIDNGVAEQLVGLRLSDLWKESIGSSGVLGRADHALFDLIGKLLGVPTWKLLGGSGQEWVPVYDTSIYFSDLLPENSTRGISSVLQEVEESVNAGHRALKIKIGRGRKWMNREDGLARDIEILETLHRRYGSAIRLMADANDQLGLDDSKSLLENCGEFLEFLEEPFPENEHDCRELREWIALKGIRTRLADGESEHDPSALVHLARMRALDILQPDIRALGLSLQWSLAQQVADLPQISIAAHNWGSYLGTFKMLQLARGIPNFLIAELDEVKSELFDDGEWEFKEGHMRVPDTPGNGLRVREDVYWRCYFGGSTRFGVCPYHRNRS